MNWKKIVSILTCGLMASNAMSMIPFTASAATGDTRTYVYDDYEITYNVTNTWGNTESVRVSITNTGDETIENWMLSYNDFNGKIFGMQM